MGDVARLAKQVQSAFTVSPLFEDHRKQIDALGLAGVVAKEVVAKSLRLVGAACEKLIEDVVGAFVELVDAAGAELVMRLGPGDAIHPGGGDDDGSR